MTIEKKGDAHIIHCDYCPEYMEIENDDSEYVMLMLNNAGWRIQKDDNDCWENVCPLCVYLPGVYKGLL